MFEPGLIPLLMVVLPLVGGVMILATGRLGAEHVRRTALTNVLVTFALAVLMVACYDPSRQDAEGRPETLQMQSLLPWVGTPPDAARMAAQALLRDSRVPAIDAAQFAAFLAEHEAALPRDEPAEAAFARLDSSGDGRVVAAELAETGPDVRIALGVDGISLWLIALSALLMIPAVLVSWHAIEERPAGFYALLLLLAAGLTGVFAAQDIILFYVFFEFTLIPLFFLVGLWGGRDRRWAARKFFIYTLAGSVLTFLGLIAIVLSYSWMTGRDELVFSIPELTQGIAQQIDLNPEAQEYWLKAGPWIFAALFVGFAVKVPLFPFHTWLPLAHVEAPTAGSVLLAGVLLKIGSYGFLRFALPLVPDACFAHFHVIAALSVIGIIYGALLALAQDDIKKLVAYSSVSHMGFCLLGLFALNSVGITGGLLQMINHGLSTGALFALVGMLYERYHTRDIESYRGLARKYPVMAFVLLVVVFSSIGLPGLNGFTGEILALMGMFRSRPLYAVLGLSGIILGAWYMLWLVQRTFFGRLREPVVEDHAPHATAGEAAGGHDAHAALRDLDARELCALAPVLVLIVWIGVTPQFFIRRMEPSIRETMQPLLAAYGRLPPDRRPFVLTEAAEGRGQEAADRRQAEVKRRGDGRADAAID